jgi:hypothetical protein
MPITLGAIVCIPGNVNLSHYFISHLGRKPDKRIKNGAFVNFLPAAELLSYLYFLSCLPNLHNITEDKGQCFPETLPKQTNSVANYTVRT